MTESSVRVARPGRQRGSRRSRRLGAGRGAGLRRGLRLSCSGPGAARSALRAGKADGDSDGRPVAPDSLQPRGPGILPSQVRADYIHCASSIGTGACYLRSPRRSVLTNLLLQEGGEVLHDAFFFAHENSLFAHKMHSLPRPPILCPDPLTLCPLAQILSARVFYSEMFATFRTQSRCSHSSSTSLPIPAARPDPPPRPPRPPRPPCPRPPPPA